MKVDLIAVAESEDNRKGVYHMQEAYSKELDIEWVWGRCMGKDLGLGLERVECWSMQLVL